MCAKKMGTSVRTLQANLSSHGLKFSDILERQRIELGKEHLQQDEMTLDEIAALLGYSEQSSFGRAFKRSEEHTSELQSLMRISYAVFCLKKKTQKHKT